MADEASIARRQLFNFYSAELIELIELIELNGSFETTRIFDVSKRRYVKSLAGSYNWDYYDSFSVVSHSHKLSVIVHGD